MSRSFWAYNIDAENPLPLVPGHDLYIMNVALSAEASSLGRTSLILSLMTESTPVLMTIGSLILGHTEQLSVNVWLEKGKKYILQVCGPNSVSVFGHHDHSRNTAENHTSTSLASRPVVSSSETTVQQDFMSTTSPISPSAFMSAHTARYLARQAEIERELQARFFR
ncbi:hypothetical protein F5879DRAFT_994062 [Lentinula edodes]|nr:hypothetical protein F5879DRAFT_994062 [Lentinula edodes]